MESRQSDEGISGSADLSLPASRMESRQSQDWDPLPIGTRLIVTNVFRPKHLPPISQPRPDGLHEVVLVRMKKEKHTFGYGVHQETREWLRPVFAVADDPKKRPAKWLGEFALADDPAMVQALAQFHARERANTALADMFTSYGRGIKKERDKEKALRARADRQQALVAQAAEAGLTADELAKAIELWNKIRRQRYSPNRCMACGRVLSDPASILTGIGPECVKYFPAIKAAARARILDVGRMRFDGARLVERFKRAGINELATVVAEAAALDGKED